MKSRLFILLAICGLLQAQQPTLEAAWDLVAKGDRQGAIRLLDQILKSTPSNGEARLLLGSIYAEAGKHTEAIGQLTEAVRLMPRSPMAHNALGEAFNATGDLKSARGAFERAVALDPKFAQARVNLGAALMQSADSASAVTHLDQAIALLGNTPEAAYPLYLRAKIYSEQQDPEKAAKALKQAVALQPDFGEAWSDLGEARKAAADDDGAFAAFQRSVEINPDNAISQYRLGAEYLRRGKANEAVAHLRESFRISPNNQSTLYSLQLALRQAGQPEEAKRIKEKLTQVLRGIDNESQNAFNALRLNNEGAALEKSGNLRGALERYRAAVALDPTHVGIRINYGAALLKLGEWKDGIGELREALRREPENVQANKALNEAVRQAPPEFRDRK